MKNIKKTKKTTSTETAHYGLIIEKLPGYFLLFCVIVAMYFFFKVLWPFWTVIFVSAVLSITFYPVYLRVKKVLKGWERSASFLTCLFVILITLVPVTIFVLMLAGEGADTYETIKTKIESGVFDEYLLWQDGGRVFDWTKGIMDQVQSVIDLENIDLKERIIATANDLSKYLISQTGTFLNGVVNFVLNFFLLLFTMFYFFKDGERIVQRIGAISPLPSVHEDELFKKMGSMVKAIVMGVFLTSIAQGVVGGIGFAIAGISSPLFWGTAMAFFSLVPLFGTAVIWVPAAIILAILGNYFGAIFLFAWGMFAIGSVDNILRPYLIGGKAHTYSLLTFFVILGGIWTWGFKGVIIGPLILMALMSFIHIYEAEYSKVLKKDHHA